MIGVLGSAALCSPPTGPALGHIRVLAGPGHVPGPGRGPGPDIPGHAPGPDQDHVPSLVQSRGHVLRKYWWLDRERDIVLYSVAHYFQ